MECRICWDCVEPQDECTIPCRCKDSSSYVHLECQIKWLSVCRQNKAKYHCESCFTPIHEADIQHLLFRYELATHTSPCLHRLDMWSCGLYLLTFFCFIGYALKLVIAELIGWSYLVFLTWRMFKWYGDMCTLIPYAPKDVANDLRYKHHTNCFLVAIVVVFVTAFPTYPKDAFQFSTYAMAVMLYRFSQYRLWTM
jgi:hypothetical protein